MARKKLLSEEAAKQVFLEELAETGNVTDAASAAGHPRRTFYNWKRKDEDFSTAWEECMDIGIAAWEDEAQRRAVQGVEEPVFYQGEEIATITKYSDSLLQFLLKGRRPDRYRENYTLTGPNNGPLQIDHDPRDVLLSRILSIQKRLSEPDLIDVTPGS